MAERDSKITTEAPAWSQLERIWYHLPGCSAHSVLGTFTLGCLFSGRTMWIQNLSGKKRSPSATITTSGIIGEYVLCIAIALNCEGLEVLAPKGGETLEWGNTKQFHLTIKISWNYHFGFLLLRDQESRRGFTMLERIIDSNHLVELLLHNGSGRNMFQQRKSTGVPLCNLSTAFIVREEMQQSWFRKGHCTGLRFFNDGSLGHITR